MYSRAERTCAPVGKSLPQESQEVFETKSLPNMVRGTGILLKIEQDEQA